MYDEGSVLPQEGDPNLSDAQAINNILKLTEWQRPTRKDYNPSFDEHGQSFSPAEE